MESCPNIILNSDTSENVAYNITNFPAYIKKGQLSSYPDFRAVSHWHDDFEFILILDGQMSYDINGHKISLQTGEGIFVNSRCFHYGYSRNVSLFAFYYLHNFFPLIIILWKIT